MAFLTDDELAGLHITKMILHVVGGGEFSPEPQLPEVEQEDFFLARIRDVNASGLFRFKSGSRTKAVIAELANAKRSFESVAQELSKEFSRFHDGTTRDGAFFIFELGVGSPGASVIVMLKYNYRVFVERTGEATKSRFRRITEAFAEDKQALQKSCIVRISEKEVLDDISARDRMGKAPNLTDYFTSFLEVERDRSDEELNRAVNESLRVVFNTIRDILPGKNVGAALSAAKEGLRNRALIDDAAIHEAVHAAADHPEAAESKDLIRKAVDRQLRHHRIGGLSFKPDAQILRKSQRRRLTMAEGITLEYPLELEGASIKRDLRPDGSATITIRTQKVEDDQIVRERIGSTN